jgi:hypothetical protein
MYYIIFFQVIVLDANRNHNEMEEEFHRCETKILTHRQRREREDATDSSVTFIGGHSIERSIN